MAIALFCCRNLTVIVTVISTYAFYDTVYLSAVKMFTMRP